MSTASSRTGRSLLAVNDLDGAAIDGIMADAERLIGAQAPCGATRFSIALVFLEPSLRTRVGFAEAARRLGGHAHDVQALRYRAEMSVPESLQDTLDILGATVDAIVVRTCEPLIAAARTLRGVSPLINAGDGDGNHPTQALIDLFAIRKHLGIARPLTIGLCGDLTMRAPRSLLGILAWQPACRIVAIGPRSRIPATGWPDGVEFRDTLLDCRGLDVLYMAGLPPGSGNTLLGADVRHRFALTLDTISTLQDGSIVLSPMPIVDEVAAAVRSDPRIKFIEQARDGIAVRMAILRHVLDQHT